MKKRKNLLKFNRFFRFFINYSVCDLDAELLANVLGNGVLVDEEVHRVGSDEGLGHIPDAFVVAGLTP